MKANELRTKSKDELNHMLISLLEEQFQLRMNAGSTETPKTHLYKKMRKDIARVKTVLNKSGRKND